MQLVEACMKVIGHRIGINGDSQAVNVDMLYDGYFRGLFPGENGRSNEASTSQTNGVK
jgi:hypothetical protein